MKGSQTAYNMRISADGKDQPALRDIAFVTPFAKKSGKSRANPVGTATSEIPGTLADMPLKYIQYNLTYSST